jgi:hypothetical protein
MSRRRVARSVAEAVSGEWAAVAMERKMEEG